MYAIECAVYNSADKKIKDDIKKDIKKKNSNKKTRNRIFPETLNKHELLKLNTGTRVVSYNIITTKTLKKQTHEFAVTTNDKYKFNLCLLLLYTEKIVQYYT